MARPRVVMRPPAARHFPAAGPGGQDRWELTAGDARAELFPARGGLISRFAVGGDELLYCERERLGARGQPLLGGLQVLFPAAGPLHEDRYELRGRSFAMRPSGLARLAPWEVVEVGGARLVMELRSSEATRINYPFAFSLRLAVDVDLAGGRGMALDLEIGNRGGEPMPYHLGWLVHLLVPHVHKADVRLDSPAAHAYDELAAAPLALGGPGAVSGMLAHGDVDLSLLDAVRPAARGGEDAQAQVRLLVPERAARTLRFSETLPVLTLQTLSYKDFVALGPWSARRDALRTGEGQRTLAPGATARYAMTLSL